MRCDVKLKILIALIFFIFVVLLFPTIKDKYVTYDPLSYIQSSIPWLAQEKMPPGDADFWFVNDKIIVVASLEKDDTSWLAADLPDWQRAVYVVNPSEETAHNTSILKTAINKGHEAMAYLTYIIDNYYSSIPSIVVFLHAHKDGFLEAWHVDTPLHSNVAAMQSLQLAFVQLNGYTNLRCNWNPGCLRLGTSNEHITGEIWLEVFGNTSTPLYNLGSFGPAALSGTLNAENKKQILAATMDLQATCCAQFTVTKEQIYARPLQDYVKIRDWVINTAQDDRHSGRVIEFLWHVIFGREAIDCPDVDMCYCNLYGRC